MVSRGSGCLLLSLAINFMLFISHDDSLNDFDPPSMCFPCRDVSRVHEVSVCVRNKESHQHLLKMMLLAERHMSNPRDITICAHFCLNQSALEDSVIRWTTNMNGAIDLVANGFQPSETGKIRIPVSGQYYIYCLLSFKFSSKSNTSDTYIKHYLYKQRGGLETDAQPTELLAIRSLNISRDVTFKNSFLSTTQNLNEGDSLFISVSNISHLYRANQFSYFGMFRL
ncbi:hypothetical protein ACJMK2_018031 [Sinanodonta woodiana]|uniref:THD domain-containing protein n=1 Tax=Sinanodonta woodiana TaxID=1069815 RepID=A0ABD3UC92_SINWO